ncbi:MAG: MurT ligase domain-containing protein [Micrococcaceae bacterium]
MSRFYSPALGKLAKKVAQLRGGGSAFPGLIMEKIDPSFIASTLAQIPRGVVLVSGTNGKTTTTKMVVELLQGQGLKVFTNKTGSNFARGVAAALINEVDINGKIDADIAVLELDEAHAVHFVKDVPPRYSLLLNVMRDQLDRFGEIDNTARMLQAIAEATTDTVVLNREDERVARIADHVKKAQVQYFGLSDKMRGLFPSDDDLHNTEACKISSEELPEAEITLENFSDTDATFNIDGKDVTTKLQLRGVYNIFNAAAAMTIARIAAGNYYKQDEMLQSLSEVKPAFGRGEKITVDGDDIELILVKNPGGFRLGLSSFKPENHKTMICINDQYADGRDMSWLWDVDFSSLKETGVEVVSGVRAYDMALRLEHDQISFQEVTPELSVALQDFLKKTKGEDKHIFCTYTAMLTLRKELAKITKVEVVE